MNPNDYQYPVDYLNQISAPPKKPGPRSNKFFLLVAAGGLILAIIIFGVLMSIANSTPKSLPTLAARLQSLQSISVDAQKNIKSSNLRATNSSLILFLTNANRDLAAPLKSQKIDVKKLDKKLIAREKNQPLLDKLEDARLNGVYDRTYAREMNYQLEKLGALMQDVYSSTRSKSLAAALVTTSNNLTPINKQLDDFTAASS